MRPAFLLIPTGFPLASLTTIPLVSSSLLLSPILKMFAMHTAVGGTTCFFVSHYLNMNTLNITRFISGENAALFTHSFKPTALPTEDTTAAP